MVWFGFLHALLMFRSELVQNEPRLVLKDVSLLFMLIPDQFVNEFTKCRNHFLQKEILKFSQEIKYLPLKIENIYREKKSLNIY